MENTRRFIRLERVLTLIFLAIGLFSLIALLMGADTSPSWDANGDGQLQVSEVGDYLNAQFANTMVLGVSLSTLIAFAMNLIGLLLVWLKARTSNQESKKVATSSADSVKRISAELERTRKEYADYVKKSGEREAELMDALDRNSAEAKRIQSNYHADAKALADSLEKSTQALDRAELSRRQLTATLKAIQCLANTEENVASGVAGQINEIVKEVLR